MIKVCKQCKKEFTVAKVIEEKNGVKYIVTDLADDFDSADKPVVVKTGYLVVKESELDEQMLPVSRQIAALTEELNKQQAIMHKLQVIKDAIVASK